MKVELIAHTDDALRSLYAAYRTCYSTLTPHQVDERIRDGRITREKMSSFMLARLETGHSSPLEQALYTFVIEPFDRAWFEGYPGVSINKNMVTVNLASMLGIADDCLCLQYDPGVRHAVAQMRRRIIEVEPIIGEYIQPKCGERRMGFCDELESSWEQCSIGRIRPHKDVLYRVYDNYRKGELQPIRDEDIEVQ